MTERSLLDLSVLVVISLSASLSFGIAGFLAILDPIGMRTF